MKQIQCPKCGEVFAIDESTFNDILVQVKTQEFNKEVNSKVKDVEARMAAENKAAVAEIEKEIGRLKAEKTALETAQKQAIEAEVAKTNANNASNLAELKQQIVELKGKLDLADKDAELKLKDALALQEKTIADLKNVIELNKKEATIKEQQINAKNAEVLKAKDEQIAYYKDLKTKMSTKLVGETLEQHCMNLFNQLRTSLFPNAYFEKDNEVSSQSGSKGDFIFRDKDGDQEYISIMFEMKNENDATAAKHKNEHFLKELDKDRNEKHCEYAVLVSMLEPENEFYNAGIVDMSYKYPKMYVIRPQCFISMITLLVNAAKNSIDYQRQLVEARCQNLDITNFENKLGDFKHSWAESFRKATDRYEDSIEGLKKTIKYLQDVVNNLETSKKHLTTANNKVEDISIKKLTHGNVTMREKFEEIEKNKEGEN